MGGIGQGLALQSFDAGLCNQGRIPWRFTGPFHHAAPARIARHIQHRRIDPVHPCRRRFPRCGAFGLFDQLRIKTRGLRKRRRKDRPIAMQHVKAEQQRDFQAAMGKGQFLQIPRIGCAIDIEKPTHRALLDRAFHIGGCIGAGDRIMARQ